MKKIGRNDPCSCRSGRKYKFCCLAREEKERAPFKPRADISPEGQAFFAEIMGRYSRQDEPLRIFCKENGFYFFRNMSLHDHLTLHEKLACDTLRKDDFFYIYKQSTTADYVERVLTEYFSNILAFKKRERQIKATVKAHFEREYELSIASFFVIIEGVLRDHGAMGLKDNFKFTVAREGVEESQRYCDADDIGYFQSFITNLYRGSAPASEFTRNTILHGMNVIAFNEENSLLLLLSFLTIANFIWNEKNWPPMVMPFSMANETNFK